MKLSQKFINIFITILGIFCSWSAMADFAIREEDINEPCYEFPVKENYGNGQSCRFRRSLASSQNSCGGRLTPEEQAALARYLPISEIGRFYGRLSAGSAAYSMSAVKNKVSAVTTTGVPFPDVGGVVTKTSASDSSPVVEIAVGYIWDLTSRAELEYIALRNFTYSSTPVLSGNGITVPRSFTSVMQANPFLLNFYYDFKWFDRFRPYVVGGIGVSFNSIRSTVSPTADLVLAGGTPNSNPATTTLRTASFAWTLGAGFRIRIFSHWYVDAQVRYVNLGIMKMKAMSNFEIDGVLSVIPATLGIIYLF